jgi:hypothetical protein
MTNIPDPNNTNPANTNGDGVVSDFEQKLYADAQAAKAKIGADGDADTGKTGSQSAEDFPVLWQQGERAPGGRGSATIRKTKTEAIAAYATGQLSSWQKNTLDSAYAKYKAAGGRAGKKGWWTDYVNAAADSGGNPFSIVAGQYGAATDGSGANGYTSGGGGSSRPSTSIAVSMYSPELANQILDAAVTATFGTSTQLTDKQRKDFYAKLTAGQKQGTVTKYTAKGSTTTTSFDEEAFKKKYIGTILENIVAKDDDIDLEGDAGAYQDTLLKYADDMGLMKGRREVNGYVKEIIGEGRSVDDVAADMRKQAGVLYSNFADRLNADPKLTVRDLVNPYLQVMADTLEIDPNTVKLTDTTIQNAISGTKLRSLSEFQTDMRADSRFSTTKTAKREAVDFAQSLLRSFGFGA